MALDLSSNDRDDQRLGHMMQVGIRPSGGLRLWDIQFNGQRIVYELALQEAMMSTTGTTPSQVSCHARSALPCPLLPCTCAAGHSPGSLRFHAYGHSTLQAPVLHLQLAGLGIAACADSSLPA